MEPSNFTHPIHIPIGVDPVEADEAGAAALPENVKAVASELGKMDRHSPRAIRDLVQARTGQEITVAVAAAFLPAGSQWRKS